jgi:putative ABC transport system permease protein
VKKAYGREERLAALLLHLCLLIVLVACLGVFALSAFSAEKRTKEIGIRKVLGASVEAIVLLLSRDLAVWVLAANIFAWPLGWWAANQWLKDFPYRVSITVFEMLLAGGIALTIALLTASVHTLRVARMNPAQSLRYE